MDRLLAAILAAKEPVSVKKQFYAKITEAGSGPQTIATIEQVLLISGNMAQDSGVNGESGLKIFTAWAGNNPEVLEKFVTNSFLLRLLDGRAEHAAASIKLLHSVIDILSSSGRPMDTFIQVIQMKSIGFIRESNGVDALNAYIGLLMSFPQCIPDIAFHPTMCLAMIECISKLSLPKMESDLVDFIKSVQVFATFTSKLWQSQKLTLNKALSLIIKIISCNNDSGKSDVPEPSVALAAVIQLVPIDVIPGAVESVLLDETLKDAELSVALHRLVNWLGWITAVNIPVWILAFLHGLAAVKKYSILICVTLSKIEVVFDCLRLHQLRNRVMPVLRIMLLSFQHSPQAFHKIVVAVPDLIRLLQSEDTPESQRNLQEIYEITHTLMYHFPGFPDLYEPVLDSLKGYDETNNDKIKSLLSEHRWVAHCHDSMMSMLRLPKSETGKVGLTNLGNTCFMNSVIQALYMCDELRHVVFSRPAYSLQSLPGRLQQLFAFLKLSERTSYSPHDFVTSSLPPWFVYGQQNDCSEYLKYLLDQLNEAEKLNRRSLVNASAPSQATTSRNAAGDQNDGPDPAANDRPDPAATTAVCSIKTKPKPDPIDEPDLTSIEHLFMGECETTFTCLDCGCQSRRSEAFFDLPLAFPNGNPDSARHVPMDDAPASLIGGNSSAACTTVSDVQELPASDSVHLEKLIHYYFQPEILKDDNQYYCTQCGELRDAERTVCIKRAPRYLIFTLLRFSYDAKSQLRTKLFTGVRYPLSLVLLTNSPHSSGKRKLDESPRDDPVGNRTSSYQLNSVVVHSGMSSESGHYYTYARHLNRSDSVPDSRQLSASSSSTWYQFNDDRVTYASYDSFTNINRRFRLDTPYVIIYKLNGQDGDCEPALDRLLVSVVERDNALYRQEQELERSNKTVNTRFQRWDKRDEDDPPGTCGLGGGFGGLNNGAKFVF